ncbi:ester cyclase [Roseicyclus persicicus]|uniref:Ester cyclase n=1 Tax=Roseicyclus persicicus TaxID=2650661 RepID=A0A7X6JXT7_9RHOB|nr:ester cyclase [Roseibacterium persicicum]NKX43724.1 ester cyclase [Roseibacterium persicicum]
MTEFQAEKAVVRAHHAAIAAAAPDGMAAALAAHTAPGWHWRGMCPIYEHKGEEAVAAAFWTPLKTALTSMQRREDIFFAGLNQIDGFRSVWVVSMGHLMGLFDAPWLGIRPTGRLAMLRYAEFHRVEGGRIVETAQFCDIPHLMQQAGQNPFGPQTGAALVQPGPLTHDGLLHGPQPVAEGEATLAAINAMISDLGTWQLGLPLEEELRRTWHEDMLWWGPAGIGATYTIPRYAKQHSGPFRAGFRERTGTGHIARLAEGHYGGFFGWPNFTAVPTGGFMGLPATGTKAEFRVVDIYRRQGGKLAENWVFIDLLHMLRTQGVDVLARMETLGPS